MREIFILTAGILMGYLLCYMTTISQKEYTKVLDKMAGFASAYSELSIQLFNAKNNTQASFTQHMPGITEKINAEQNEFDEDDLLAGILRP